MNRDELADQWDANKHRPQFVRQYRDEILEHTTDAVAEAMPAPLASTFEYRQFLKSHKGVVTTQLRGNTSEVEA